MFLIVALLAHPALRAVDDGRSGQDDGQHWLGYRASDRAGDRAADGALAGTAEHTDHDYIVHAHHDRDVADGVQRASGLAADAAQPGAHFAGAVSHHVLHHDADVFQTAYEDGVQPLLDNSITEEVALERIGDPFHDFMIKHVQPKDLSLFVSMSPGLTIDKPENTPFRVLIPAFMISELKRSFEIGFLVFIPFVIIDMLVASILMAMGMMMLFHRRS